MCGEGGGGVQRNPLLIFWQNLDEGVFLDEGWPRKQPI